MENMPYADIEQEICLVEVSQDTSRGKYYDSCGTNNHLVAIESKNEASDSYSLALEQVRDVYFRSTSSASVPAPLVLVGLESICHAVGAGPRTVKQWIAKDGFPARRCSDGVYRANPYSILHWFARM